MIGKTLSHFEITAKLGEGGMGEVYSATDTKLGREVAIKVLPEAVARDPERLARFEREAKVLASLNHPHIAAIYSLESVTGYSFPEEQQGGADQEMGSLSPQFHFLVMELAEGEDLAARIARGPLPVDEALPVALQIAEALEAAHERGIIHRDLKPANVKVDPEGQVKVLDFGLAKALDPAKGAAEGGPDAVGTSPSPAALSLSPTLTQQMTEAGIILGTAAYMAPEQAKGRTVDKRADIWAFGVMVWEVLTGRKLFAADSVPETLGAIFTRTIDLDALPALTPRRVHELLARCLERDPRQRLRDIGEARIAIQSAMAGADLGHEIHKQEGRKPRIRPAALLIAGVTAGLLLGVVGAWQLRPAPKRSVVKLQVPTDSLRADRARIPLISPDGTRILIPESRGLVIRSLDSMTGILIPDTLGARYLCWSPDSREIAFVIGFEIRRATVDSGATTPVVKLPNDVGGSGGMVWTASDHLLVAGGDVTGIMQIPIRGGEFKELVPLDKAHDVDLHELSLLPNREDLLYVLHRKDPEDRERLVDTIGAVIGGHRREILRLEGESILAIAYSPSGHLLFHRGTTTTGTWAVPFSLDLAKVTGEPFLVAADTWLPSVSDDGTLLLVEGLTESPKEIVEVDRQGNVLRKIAQIQGDGEGPHLSPDHTRLLVTSVEASNWDIWIYDLDRGTHTRLTFESTFDAWGRWSPEGDKILYSVADVREIKVKQMDGSGEAVTVGEGLGPDWIPDGSGFVFEHYSNETNSWDISYKHFDEDSAVPFLSSPANESAPRVSPDGRYLLYLSDETGEWEVFARSFPDGNKKWQISTGGGRQADWSPTGREIFYVQGDNLMSIELVDPDRFSLGRPEQLLAATILSSSIDIARINTFGPGPDGQTFFLVRDANDKRSPSRLMLIQNWAEEFTARP